MEMRDPVVWMSFMEIRVGCLEDAPPTIQFDKKGVVT